MTVADRLEYDYCIVGAGPAGLACAIRLKQLLSDASVCVLDKAATVGAHALSGAVLEPSPLEQLLPGWRAQYPGMVTPVAGDEFRFLTAQRSIRLPVPPTM